MDERDLNTSLMANMSEKERMLFHLEMAKVQKSPGTALLLTFFIGGLGAHRFYLGQVGLGLLYVLFVWTFVPLIISIVELFLISGRVRNYNKQKAWELSRRIKNTTDRAVYKISDGPVPATTQESKMEKAVLFCTACGTSLMPEGQFCFRCGAARVAIDQQNQPR